MLYDFAITPDVFEKIIIEDVGRSSLINILFDLSQDGILANLGKGKWRDLVESEIFPLADDITRANLKTCFNILWNRNRLIDCPPSIDDVNLSDIDWPDVVTEADKIFALYAVLTTITPFPREEIRHKCISFPPNPMRSRLWKDYRETPSLEIQKTEDNYRKALAPILGYAKKVQLIDPYFNCFEERYKSMIDIIAELTTQARFDRNSGEIEIHTSTTKYEHEKEEWKQILQPLADENGHRFGVHVWKKYPSLGRRERQHDRFILTDQCGILSSYGFDIQDSENTRLALLKYEERTKLRTEYNKRKKSSRYEYVKGFSITPT